MRKLRLASLALVLGLMAVPTSLSACGDEETIVPGQDGAPAQVAIDTSETLSLQVDRPLWPYHVRWQLPKNIVMERQRLEIDYTQTYEVGSHDFGYFRYTERVMTSNSVATEVADPIGAEIALLKSEHPGSEDFPLGKLPSRVSGRGLKMTTNDWTGTMHVYYVHLADAVPASGGEDSKITGYLLTFETAGAPDHPWGGNGLFTRAVFQTLSFTTR